MTDRHLHRFRDLDERCAAGRAAVIEEIGRIMLAHGPGVGDLNALLLDYPFRPAKALRPTLCLGVSRALGCSSAAALPSAAALELLHNAFLIHDDVEDGSLSRRGAPTLHEVHGVPTAVNVADGMFALSLFPLLDNCEVLGIGPALAILETIAETVRITVEGQALELSWIRENRWGRDGLSYRDAYVDLVVRKTAHYSFVAPVAIGCIVAGASPRLREELSGYARHLGIAFQITDDVLNLAGDEDLYGKEQNGDLWEGKRTLILMHALTLAGATPDRERALAILARPRPRPQRDGPAARGWLATVERLAAEGRISVDARDELVAAARADDGAKTATEVRFLRDLIEAHGSVAAARAVAVEHCARAGEILSGVEDQLEEGTARRFLRDLVTYVVERLK